MEFTKEELEIEELNLETSNICLSSSSLNCDVCKTGNVVKVGRETSIVIYTRTGTKRGVHVEMKGGMLPSPPPKKLLLQNYFLSNFIIIQNNLPPALNTIFVFMWDQNLFLLIRIDQNLGKVDLNIMQILFNQTS